MGKKLKSKTPPTIVVHPWPKAKKVKYRRDWFQAPMVGAKPPKPKPPKGKPPIKGVRPPRGEAPEPRHAPPRKAKPRKAPIRSDLFDLDVLRAEIESLRTSQSKVEKELQKARERIADLEGKPRPPKVRRKPRPKKASPAVEVALGMKLFLKGFGEENEFNPRVVVNRDGSVSGEWRGQGGFMALEGKVPLDYIPPQIWVSIGFVFTAGEYPEKSNVRIKMPKTYDPTIAYDEPETLQAHAGTTHYVAIGWIRSDVHKSPRTGKMIGGLIKALHAARDLEMTLLSKSVTICLTVVKLHWNESGNMPGLEDE